MKIIITGGTGFIGSYLVKDLLKENHQLLVLTRQQRLVSDQTPRLSYLESTFRDFEKHFDGNVDMVIHLAADIGRESENSEIVFDSNFNYPNEVLAKAMDVGCKYFINTDSYYTLAPSEFSHLRDYIESKIAFRDHVKSIESLKIVNMRLFHVYGKQDGASKFIPWLAREISKGGPGVKLGTPCAQVLDFVHVSDVSRAYVSVVNNIGSLAKYTEFEVGTGEGTILKDVCYILHHALQKENKEYFPDLIFPEKSGSQVLFPSEFVASKEKIESIGWQSIINVNDGIEAYVKNEF
jgi:nucleoside-diphosphate-sugar epimerase